MLIAFLLLLGVPIEPPPPLSYALPPTVTCQAFRDWRMIASGVVYCDAQKTHVAEIGSVTLMEADRNPDDVAEYWFKGIQPRVDLVNGRFEVGGSMTDWWAGNIPEPYLLVKGVCPVENFNGVVERKHVEEKVGLPCNWECNQDRIDIRGLGILLDGVSDSEIC